MLRINLEGIHHAWLLDMSMTNRDNLFNFVIKKQNKHEPFPRKKIQAQTLSAKRQKTKKHKLGVQGSLDFVDKLGKVWLKFEHEHKSGKADTKR